MIKLPLQGRLLSRLPRHARFSTSRLLNDAHLKELGKIITTDFASVKEHYGMSIMFLNNSIATRFGHAKGSIKLLTMS